MLKLILTISVLFMMILVLLGVSGATKSAKTNQIWSSTKKCAGTPFVLIVELPKKLPQNEREFEEHSQEHLGEQYRCEQCNKTFTKKHKLSEHTRHIHTGQHICEICAKNFTTDSNLKQHINF